MSAMKAQGASVLRALRRRGRGKGGYTLAELMLALTLFSFTAAGAASLTFATYNTNETVRSTASTSEQIESAVRRIVELVRCAEDISLTSNGLMIQTPSDGAYVYVYTYYLTPAPNNAAQSQLHEMVQRANATATPLTFSTRQDVVLIDSAVNCTATRLGTSLPQMWRITLSAGPSPVVTRSVIVTGRNLDN